jgi:hypothetical protein
MSLQLAEYSHVSGNTSWIFELVPVHSDETMRYVLFSCLLQLALPYQQRRCCQCVFALELFGCSFHSVRGLWYMSISLLNSITTIRVRSGPTIHSLGGDETPEANQALPTRQAFIRNPNSPQKDSIIRHNSKHVRAKLATQTTFSSVLH